jgi:hypothetical protein
MRIDEPRAVGTAAEMFASANAGCQFDSDVNVG